jgi:hypothetical protein
MFGIDFGVAYQPGGSFRECSNEKEARDCFERAPQPDDQWAVLVIDGKEVDSRPPGE